MSTHLATNIIISAPPFSQIDGKEGLDLALVCAAFEQTVNLIFVDAGVLHLLEGQDETGFADKFHDQQLQALEFYEIDTIYAERESVEHYSLFQSKLLDNVNIVPRDDIRLKCSSAKHTVIF